MPRLFAFLGALLMSAIAVSSACIASAAYPLSFTLVPEVRGDRLHVAFRKTDRENSNWSSSFAVNELNGLDAARLRASAASPVRFAIIREAGRVDCSGTGGNSRAAGACRFTADQGFTQLLVGRGIKRPSDDQAFALVAVNARRDLVDALAAARYPVPTVDQLIALTAVGANGRYIADLARVGYRPATLDHLLQFRALNITPEFIQGFVRLGYGNLAPGELVQLKALDIDADFIAGFERIGYGRLRARDLVQLKALGITPEYVRSVQRGSSEPPSLDRIVQLRALGFRPRSR